MCAPADVVTFLSAHKGLRNLDIDRTVGCGPLWYDSDDDLDGQEVGDLDGTEVGDLDGTEVGDLDGPDYFEALEQHLDCPSDILPDLETLACFPGQAVDILKSMFTNHGTGKSFTNHGTGKSVKLILKDEGREDDNPRSEEFRDFARTHTTELTVIRHGRAWKW